MPRVRSLKGLLGLVVLLSLLGFSKGQWAQPRPLSDVVSNFNRRAFAAANYEAPVAAGLPNTTPNPYRPPDPQPRQEFPSQQQQQQQSNFYPFFNNNPPPQPPPLYNFNPITSYGGPQPQNNRYEAPAQRPETHYEAPLPTNYPSGVAYYQPNRGNPNNSKRPVLLISSYANGGGGSYDQPKGPFVPPNSQTNFNNNYPPPNPPSISPYENTRAPPTTEKPHQTLVPPADDTSYEENPYGEPENPETPKAPNSNYPGPSPPAPTPPSQPPQPTYPEEEGPPPQAPNPYETPSPPPSPEQPPAPQTPGIPPNIPSPPERPPTSPEIPSIPSQPHVPGQPPRGPQTPGQPPQQPPGPQRPGVPEFPPSPQQPGQPPMPPQRPPSVPNIPGQPPFVPNIPGPPPNVPQIPRFPTSPPQIPGQPPKMPPNVPGQPPSPEIPGQPPSPEIPERPPPNIPGQPEIPGMPPNIPGQPQTPGFPTLPPQIPGQPEIPNIPGLPTPPPSQPMIPGQPERPETPSPPTPLIPNIPQMPGGPPRAQPPPTQPQIPGQPETPPSPGVPSPPPPGPERPGFPSSPPPEFPTQPPQIPGQPPPQQPEIPGFPPTPNIPGQPERPPPQSFTPRIPRPPPSEGQFTPPPGFPPSPQQPQIPGQPQRPPSFPGQPPRFPTPPVPSSPGFPQRPNFPTPFPPQSFSTPPSPFIPGRPFIPPGKQTPPPGLVTANTVPPPRFPPQQPPHPSPSSQPPSQPPQPNTPPTQPPNGPMVPNRIRGKAHVICEESGANFNIKTIFPFTGQIFAHDRKRTPNCVHTFRESWNINISFSYAECGIKNSGDRESAAQTQFHLQIIVMFEQPDGTSSIQSFMAQCIHQKINYNKQLIPKRIEEALEELKLVPAKLEQKAPMPIAEMKIVKEVEHHAEGDGEDISKVDVGQPLRIEWNLKPESDAYGFHVRDCYVTDAVDGARHQVIDERGCSTDINILGHPHYDTYHDIARVHWHAFKVPDNTVLSIKCNIQICTDIPDSSSGLTSCDAIPTPPFCPDLVTSPTNSILFDVQGNIVKRNVGIQKSFSTHVHADICFGNSTDGYCNSKAFEKARLQHLERIHKETDNKFCTSRLWLAAISGLTLWTVILAVGLNIIFFIRHKWIKTGH